MRSEPCTYTTSLPCQLELDVLAARIARQSRHRAPGGFISDVTTTDAPHNAWYTPVRATCPAAITSAVTR